jgi:hypothetical protein
LQDEIYSMISRTSIDTLKEHFWEKVRLSPASHQPSC